MKDTKVLIVDRDEGVCQRLSSVLSSWKMTAGSATNPFLVRDQINKTFHDIILLDAEMCEIQDLDLIGEIEHVSPDTRVIVLTDILDDEGMMKDLHRQAFGFLRKPVSPCRLFQTLKRALVDQRVTLEHRRLLEKLEVNEETVRTQTSQLEQLNSEVMAFNREFAAFLHSLEASFEGKEHRLLAKIRPLLTSLTSELRDDENFKKYKEQLEVLESYIDQLGFSFTNNAQDVASLSLTELRIASLVRNGMTSEEIAAFVHVSPDTVKTHRRNIRRKLGIIGTKEDLKSHLSNGSQGNDRDAGSKGSTGRRYRTERRIHRWGRRRTEMEGFAK